MLRAKSPRESRIVGNPPVRFDEGEGSFIGPSLLYRDLSGLRSPELNAQNNRGKFGLLLGAKPAFEDEDENDYERQLQEQL